MTLGELALRFDEIAKAVGGPDGPHTAHAMAEECKVIVQTILSGPSPSAPGTPPGLRTGQLRESIVVTPASGGGGEGEAACMATAHYAAAQEYGAHIVPHGHPYLRWIGPNGYVFKHEVTLPPRPFMRIAMEMGISSGAFERAAIDAFREDTGL